MLYPRGFYTDMVPVKNIVFTKTQNKVKPLPLSSVHLWDQESKSFEAVQFGNGRNVKINNSI